MSVGFAIAEVFGLEGAARACNHPERDACRGIQLLVCPTI